MSCQSSLSGMLVVISADCEGKPSRLRGSSQLQQMMGMVVGSHVELLLPLLRLTAWTFRAVRRPWPS